MDKKGNEHIPCMLCSEEAEPGTNPPLCAKHRDAEMTKEAANGTPCTLKELDAQEAPNDGGSKL